MEVDTAIKPPSENVVKPLCVVVAVVVVSVVWFQPFTAKVVTRVTSKPAFPAVPLHSSFHLIFFKPNCALYTAVAIAALTFVVRFHLPT